MVADNIDAEVAIAAADTSSSPVGVKDELPAGNYVLVGVDIDTTGRRLIDEVGTPLPLRNFHSDLTPLLLHPQIVQLAAYTPTDHFEQYIMPYMNLNPAARQRHQVRVISIGFYRMLKSMQTYKVSLLSIALKTLEPRTNLIIFHKKEFFFFKAYYTYKHLI